MNGNDPRSQDYGQAVEDAVDRAIRAMEKLSDKDAFEEYVRLTLAGGATYADLMGPVSGDYCKGHAESLAKAFGEGCMKEGY